MVTLAEKAGKHVELMVVPGSDPYEAVVQTAALLQSSRIVMGLSPKLTPSEQGAQVGRFWEQLPEPRPSLSLEIVLENQKDVGLLQPGTASAATVAGGYRTGAPPLAGTERPGSRSEAASPRHHRRGAAAHDAELHSERADEVVEDVLSEVGGRQVVHSSQRFRYGLG